MSRTREGGATLLAPRNGYGLDAIPAELWKRLRSGRPRLLLLDYDGTLAPFHVERMRARMPGPTERALRRIAVELRDIVAIVSGRPLDELIALAGELPVHLVGSHGWQQRTAEGHRLDESPPPLPIPAYLVPPSIDPLSDKNRELDPDEERALLVPFDLPARVPLVTQVSRFDRLEDPLGVLEAFELVRREEPAHLVLAGGTAADDPEGAEVLAEVRARAGARRDVTLLDLPPDAHRVINALQRRSAVVVQKSLREGFALTVAEALWKRRAVVAGAVGGIPLQVLHERTGLLVRSVPGCAHAITRLLRSPELRRRLAREGHEHVRRNFLLPREAIDYLAVFASLLDAHAPRVAGPRPAA